MSHAKRIASGAGKAFKWAYRPSPGSHPLDKSITLVAVLRDALKVADNSREAVKILKGGSVLVDGIVEKNPKTGVGLMDVVTLSKANVSYRVIPTKKGLQLLEIDAKEAKTKLLKVVGKTTVSKGRTQLSFHDGTTSVDAENKFKVNDVAVIALPDRKIRKRIEFAEGATAIVVSGRHSGDQGKVSKILPAIASRRSLTTVGELETLTDYVFTIGTDGPEVTVA